MKQEFLHGLLSQYLLPLKSSKTATEIFQLCQLPETRTPPIAATLDENQAYLHFMHDLSLVRQSQSKWSDVEEAQEDEVAHLQMGPQRMVNTFGKKGTRNLVLSLALLRARGPETKEEGLPRTSEDTLDVKPHDLLKHFLEVETINDDHMMAHTETSVIGGLLFDWLEILAERSAPNPKQALKDLEVAWNEGLHFASISYHLAKTIPNFARDTFIFVAPLALAAGKFLMSLSFSSKPGWNDFLKEVEPFRLACPEIISGMERARFETTHAQLASLICVFFPGLQSIERAVYYHNEPFALKKRPEQGYILAVLLFLGDYLTFVDKPADVAAAYARLTPEQQLQVKDLKISLKQMESAVARAIRKGGS